MPGSYLPPVMAGAAVIALGMLILWLVQLRTKDAGIVDAGWALSLGGLGVWYSLAGPGDPARRLLLGVISGFWGCRLALHLLTDRIIGKHEDGRYQQMRRERGAGAGTFFFIFFQAQGLFAVILSLPFLLAAFDPRPAPGLLDWAAAVLWVTGLTGESIADGQLAAWRRDPGNRGRTCRAGFWRWSRHPNYFFEWLIWCAYALLALGAPGGWLGLISPAIMLYLILFVTGIPPTEAQALRSRGEDYRRYQRTTSPLIPWFPRKEAG